MSRNVEVIVTTSGGTREGYFVIADISGYAAFLTGTELEHAQGIIAELITSITYDLAPPMTLAKLEGDAVFAYAEARVFDDAERLLELIEVCYYEFRAHLENMQRSTTCRCAACASIGSLDLKFVAHYGTYMAQRIAGGEELAGADVILVHRLLKNSVVEATSCSAYAFLTDGVLSRFAIPPLLPRHAERYEALGEVQGAVRDLSEALNARRALHREYVTAEEADLVVEAELPAPPADVWPWLVEPAKMLAWNGGMLGFENKAGADGRLGVGAESHCAHGSWNSVIRYIDWRPYEYFTTHQVPTKSVLTGAPAMMTTSETLDAGNGRTLYRFRLRVDDRGIAMRLKLPLMRAMARRALHQHLRKLACLIEDAQGARSGVDE